MPAANNEVAVLIPAAGQGRRMGGEKKQFRLLGGKPLLTQTISAFQRHQAIDYVVVAVAPADTERVAKELHSEGLTKVIRVVSGGDSRQASIFSALKATPESAGIVLVHDAVRPFIEAQTISDLITAVQSNGAAAPALAVVDTLRVGHGDTFQHTLPRDGVYRMQTPQGGLREWFEKAYKQAEREGWTATDDVDLLQRAGFDVTIRPGSSLNFKITTPADWELARILWPYWKEQGA